MFEKIYTFLIDLTLTSSASELITRIILLFAIIILCILSNFIAKIIIHSVFGRIVQKTKNTWDDILYKKKVLSNISHIAPALIVFYTVSVLNLGSALTELISRLAIAYMYGVTVLLISSIFDTIHSIYLRYPIAKSRPIKGYIQVIKTFVSIFGIILMFTTIINKSPLAILTSLGAMSAVLLLVFKDSILGLVASIQLSVNDMVKIGDWIEMEKYGADGDVIDITLQSVKVQNWDMTITTIPLYALIADSFKNWRGMTESGGRRIKRSIIIDVNTIRFLTQEDIHKLSRFQLLQEYLAKIDAEIQAFNETHDCSDPEDFINGRHLTNIGTFQVYMSALLKENENIHQEMIQMVRQMPVSDKGLALEIYAFSKNKNWPDYEKIQANLFDHLLAIVPFFGLKVYQNPSGHDIQKILESISQKS